MKGGDAGAFGAPRYGKRKVGKIHNLNGRGFCEMVYGRCT